MTKNSQYINGSNNTMIINQIDIEEFQEVLSDIREIAVMERKMLRRMQKQCVRHRKK